MSDGYKLWAGEKGSKIKRVGAEQNVYAYTNLETCLADAMPDDVIYLEQGTYSLTSIATINYNVTIIGIGRVTINGGTDGLENRLIMINKPSSGTAITYIEFRNIRFVNAYSGADVIEIDNDGGGTGALKVKFFDCGFTSNSGLAIDLDQTTNTIDIELVVKGYQSVDLNLDSCNFALTKAGSEVYVIGYWLDGDQTFALGTTNVAAVYNWIQCVYTSEAFTSGGAASIIENAIGCAKIASNAIAAPVIEDFDATAASENIQVGTLDT